MTGNPLIWADPPGALVDGRRLVGSNFISACPAWKIFVFRSVLLSLLATVPAFVGEPLVKFPDDPKTLTVPKRGG